MAEKTINTHEHEWKIDTSINNIIGKGAYGIVYKAVDEHGKTFAVKTIDGKQHPRVLNQNLDKLLQLNHPNLVKILDVHLEEQTFYMFMIFCPMGDLNKFFRKRKLHLKDKIYIMEQVANGLVYLHSNNVIHRDIKPDNILIGHGSSVTAKLTDFDLSKVLDPDIETSVMTSNVGTLGYKAPEFFQRTIRKEIFYHRNVDVYATGLTYLAMVQYDEESRMLIPRIETPQDYSELHAPIGQLVAERIKYKVPEMNIVVIKDDADEDMKEVTTVKKLIQKMTWHKPEERLSADEVLGILRQILQSASEAENIQTLPTTEAQHTMTHLTTEVKKSPMYDTTESQQTQTQPTTEVQQTQAQPTTEVQQTQAQPTTEVQQRKMQPVNKDDVAFTKSESWTLNTKIQSINMNHQGELLTRVKRNGKYFIRSRSSRSDFKEIPAACDHNYYFFSRMVTLAEHPFHVVEVCWECGAVRVYDTHPTAGGVVSVYKKCLPRKISAGPGGSVLILDDKYRMLQLKWLQDAHKLQLVRTVQTSVKVAWSMVYVEEYNILVITSASGGGSPDTVEGVNMDDGSTLWRLRGVINSRKIHPCGVCRYGMKRVFIADGLNGRVLVLNSKSGENLTGMLSDQKFRIAWDVWWYGDLLTVLHDGNQISRYKLA